VFRVRVDIDNNTAMKLMFILRDLCGENPLNEAGIQCKFNPTQEELETAYEVSLILREKFKKIIK
jgi:hypothetical protein